MLIRLTIMLVLICLTLVGCGKEANDTKESKQQSSASPETSTTPSGRVTLGVYASRSAFSDKFLTSYADHVRKRFGIDVKVELRPKKSDEHAWQLIRQGKADVLMLSSLMLELPKYGLLDKGLLAPIREENITQLKDCRDAFREHPVLFHKGQRFAVMDNVNYFGLIWREDHFPDGPPDPKVIWDPVFKDRFGFMASDNTVHFAALAQGFRGKDAYTYDTLNTPEFRAKIKYLCDNSKRQWPVFAKPEQVKDLSLCISFGSFINQARKEGQKWRMLQDTSTGAGWSLYCIPATAAEDDTRRTLAEAFIDFALYPYWQTELTLRKRFRIPANKRCALLMTDQEKHDAMFDDPDWTMKLSFAQSASARDYNGVQNLIRDANKGNEHKIVR